MYQTDYSIKITVLFLSTLVSIFIIWYALVREESADWISAQIVHQASPYAVTEAADGRLIVDNVVMGYGFNLPRGFKTAGARNLEFYREEDGKKTCPAKHYNIIAKQADAGTESDGRVIVPYNGLVLVFDLTGPASEWADCMGYLKQIKPTLFTE
ncbi:hypothetical protein A3H09_00605 [Candidatus Falkowbacteria bacterium RIFCSPLOWO2_12_FULL_45_13]|uniref:Uncharacterized protein n=2 Tax=Candidatus Falkowiibacteriota TaxID=1752728 RepID=A0A1F5SDC1_9BACT|nr:MAG: hypothetical protein A3H66_02875 [Candidatus Falkowbacteria bacterium RIFCSPLOWO2_02_FULL_45_21]OGF30781.1 MAG: hypothetical protein A3H09_00605 [Candidatus Falkowbacteria bacterium RIFCSPLOWO2_12_FULL_45_13]